MTTIVSRRLEGSEADVRAAAREAVEAWGGSRDEEGDHDRIRLPVQAGLRNGVAAGTLRVREETGGVRVELELEPVAWRVHAPAVALLAAAAVAGIAVVLWPWFPALGAFVPLGLLVGLGAWFLVVSRLQNRGPEELLVTIEGGMGAEGRKGKKAEGPERKG